LGIFAELGPFLGKSVLPRILYPLGFGRYRPALLGIRAICGPYHRRPRNGKATDIFNQILATGSRSDKATDIVHQLLATGSRSGKAEKFVNHLCVRGKLSISAAIIGNLPGENSSVKAIVALNNILVRLALLA
jgi:hypothetical protein